MDYQDVLPNNLRGININQRIFFFYNLKFKCSDNSLVNKVYLKNR